MGKKDFCIRPFEKLNKKIDQSHPAPSAPPPCRKKREDFTEEELFRSEMGGVQEIGAFRSLACAQRRRKAAAAPEKCDPDRDALVLLGEIAAGSRSINLSDTQEYVEWINPAFREHLIGSLREGRFSIQAFLDLHGCVVGEAEEELDDFIGGSLKKGLRCVKIIHGRGLRSPKGARIKEAVVKRLSGHFRKHVIAFVTARQCDGGLGALYVLLQQGNQDRKTPAACLRAGL